MKMAEAVFMPVNIMARAACRESALFLEFAWVRKNGRVLY